MIQDKPRALDLFCGAGGATRGLQQAGFHVTGVDINPQPRYCGDVFIQADALTIDVSGYELVWSSPPCQHYSRASACRPGLKATYPDLVEPTRNLLRAKASAWVIENVPGAPLINPIRLCGAMFGRPLYRHRLFETSLPIPEPAHVKHLVKCSRAGHWKPGTYVCVAGNCAPIALAREAMGVAWTTRRELAESIPPVFSEYIGRQFLAILAQHPNL